MSTIDSMSHTISYEDVRLACKGEPFTMSLVDRDEINAVIKAVNQGIDSHLEACNCPQRGDSYQAGKRMIGDIVTCRTLECIISVESLPVLIRRLTEEDEAGEMLADAILSCLTNED